MKNKKGVMELSFGMIFSLILIIVFIAFAIWAIFKFLDLQDSIKISQFENKLQSEIDKMWKSPQGSHEVSYVLPSNIISVCFVDDDYENMIYKAKNIMKGKNIEHINLAAITEKESPFCIEKIQGKLTLTLKKDYGDPLVVITR